jgi:hypothetical protein
MAVCVLPHTSLKMSRDTPIAAAVLMLALTGCSQKTLDSTGISSQLRATSSLAMEADVFIEYLRTGHSSAAFARSHAEYLARELDDERHELEGARTAPPLMGTLELCRAQQEQLGRELRRLEPAIGHPGELPEIARQIRAAGEAAAQARKGL